MDATVLERLVARHLDGSATPTEVAALDVAVRSDVQAARLLARAARLDAALRQVHRVIVDRNDRSEGSITARLVAAEQAAAQRSARIRRRPRAQRVQRFPQRWAWAAAAALLLGLAFFAWSGGGSPFLQDGRGLAAGTSLRGTLAISGGGSVELSAQAVAVAGGTAKAPRLELQRGTVRCTVEARDGRPPFVVATPHGEIRVIGTVFSVAVAEEVQVTVEHGLVEAVAQGATQRVTAGARARLAKDAPPAVFGPVAQLVRSGTAADWNIGSPHVQATAAGTGPTGNPAVRLALDGTAAGTGNVWRGMFWSTDLPDWSHATGLSLVLYGEGAGRRIRFDLADNCPPDKPGNWRDCERFSVEILDDVRGWREIRLPFSSFARLPMLTPEAPQDGLGLTAVRGFHFNAMGTASLLVERIGIYSER